MAKAGVEEEEALEEHDDRGNRDRPRAPVPALDDEKVRQVGGVGKCEILLDKGKQRLRIAGAQERVLKAGQAKFVYARNTNRII